MLRLTHSGSTLFRMAGETPPGSPIRTPTTAGFMPSSTFAATMPNPETSAPLIQLLPWRNS